MRIIALRVMADTGPGYRDGVPKLLSALDAAGGKCSIFFAMGAEEPAGVLSRIFRDEREIVASAPGIIRDAHRRGHDCGICGRSAREWETKLERIKDTTLDSDLRHAAGYFTRRTGTRPTGFAAPGFRLTYMSLRIIDDMELSYCCGSLGRCPFIPKMSWKEFETPQIPATVPPLDAVLRGASEAEARVRLSALYQSLPDGLSVLPLSAGLLLTEAAAPFAEFLCRCAENGARLMTLKSVMDLLDPATLPRCELIMRDAPEMSGGEVAVQGE